MNKLSNRAERALDVLQAGGYFRKQLETAYKGGEQFVTSLRDADGRKVKGFGFKTRVELSEAGKLAHRTCLSSTVWPEEWALN